ncbi:FAD binding domain-containing protein [Jannaschia pohangensis]|uniref:CO or xanthine dehydrogenase, FAD-binding subunit n=1 Tax=Jannaschia pohangensis TaxID=390807 RepID=A0A1I3H9K5_9RHOB|nr:FAD binding domain-containing protein [Jannaschia pohangensis]SFI32322.1 CO or xanthine dehydrogenase, FAD-binding subunit [Jannaschia pohangensis]
MAFTIETYATTAEAARAMGADARFLAGGTLVMRDVNAGDQSFTRIIRSTDPALTAIRGTGDGISVGACVTLHQIVANPDLAFLAPVARQVGGPQVRNMGTVGGNLFAPHPYGDFTVALLAIGAKVTTAQGQKPVDDFLRDRDRSGLVTEILIPRPRDPGSFGWHKVSRTKPKGASVMSIAAYLPREGGRIRNVRIAFGAMGGHPLRATGAERALEGQSLDASTIARAAAVTLEGLSPPTDPLASEWYRREVAAVHLTRLLTRMERS